MSAEVFSEAMGLIGEKYIMEAATYQRKKQTITKVWLSRVAGVLLAILLAGSALLTFSTEARAAFFGWVRQQYENFYEYFFEGEAAVTDPAKYELGWVPEGCIFVTSYEIPGGKSFVYTDEKESLICFTYQVGADGGSFFVDNAKAEKIDVTINGCTGEISLYKDEEETDHIIWTDSTNTVLFYITGHFDQETFIKMAESVIEIGSRAFYRCKTLTDFVITEGITMIDDSMFYGCESLVSLVIPSSVTAINEHAFFGCTSFAYVYFGGSEDDWKNIVVGEYNTHLPNAEV